MIVELEINGARVIISGDNLTVNVTGDDIGFIRREPDEFPTAAKIRFLRQSMNIGQCALATLLDVSQGTVSKWERGQDKPRGPAAIRLINLIKMHSGASS